MHSQTRTMPAAVRPGRVSSELLLRAIAISAIVLHHSTSSDLGGGIGVLLLLVGLNLARFQSKQLASDRRWLLLRHAALKVLLPYYGILIGYSAWHGPGEVGLQDVLLLSNLNPDNDRFLVPYWFVAAYFQFLLAIILLSALPPVTKLLKRRPDVFGLWLLAATLIIKIVTLQIFSHEHLLGRTIDQFLYIVAFGWCIQFTQGRQLSLAMATLAIALAVIGQFAPATAWSGFDGRWHHAAVFLAVLALLFVPTVTVGNRLRAIISALSIASFTIYLVHPLILALWKAEPEWQVLAGGVSIAIGVLVSRTINVVRHIVRTELGQRPHMARQTGL